MSKDGCSNLMGEAAIVKSNDNLSGRIWANVKI
jgi:hypothetical protein